PATERETPGRERGPPLPDRTGRRSIESKPRENHLRRWSDSRFGAVPSKEKHGHQPIRRRARRHLHPRHLRVDVHPRRRRAGIPRRALRVRTRPARSHLRRGPRLRGPFQPGCHPGDVSRWAHERDGSRRVLGAQFAGGLLASLVLGVVTSRGAVAETATGYATLGMGIMSELVLTAVFVLVILASTRTAPATAGIAISLTLVAVHFAGIPFSGASVNPARSFGPAVVGGTFTGLWLYLVVPLVGGLVAWGLWQLFEPEPEEAEAEADEIGGTGLPEPGAGMDVEAVAEPGEPTDT